MENKQKEYVDKVMDISIGILQTSNNYFDKESKTYIPGKRVSLGTYQLKDYITVGSNQIIFELDAPSYHANYILARKIITALQQRNIPFYIFSSGGKGIHIEMWFTKPEFKEKEIKDLFKDALSYNLSFKDIRFWLFNEVLKDAGIAENLIGTGKTIDTSCLNFDDINSKTRLIRLAGGRKIKFNKVTEETTIYYKTYIKEDIFTERQVKEDAFENVCYPANLSPYQLDESEFGLFLSNYVNLCKTTNKTKLSRHNLKDIGGYINLESVKRVREGLSSGQRNLGAQILAIAMANDNLTSEEQVKIMEDYVSKCSQIGERFTITEAKRWIDWVKTQPDIFWNCSLSEEGGLHDATLCDICCKKNKEALTFLQQTTLLQQIKEVLDEEIIGEDENKMLVFLLLLSKDFPSKTGKPGWCISGDPMSQNIILAADSSSGKTYMTKKILDLLGDKEQDYFIISRTTKNALNYYTDQDMDGKVIFIEELQGLDENTAQLRVWMSEGELTLNTVEKVKNEEGVEVNQQVKRRTVGQPVFITNQAEGKIEDQLNNRSWVLGLDTSGEQTAKILDFQDKMDKGTVIIDEVKKQRIKDALKQLKPYHFRIDFLDNKFLKIPTNDVRSRRDYQKFKTLIKCSAYLHQKQREIRVENGKEFLICDIKDYDIAKQYASEILGATFSGLTVTQIDLINFLKKQSWNQEFTISDIMRNLNKTQPYWYGQLEQLTDLGYITSDKRGVGKTTIYQLNLYKVINIINLPSGEEIKNIQKNILSETTYNSTYNSDISEKTSNSDSISPVDSENKGIGCSQPITAFLPELDSDNESDPKLVIGEKLILPISAENEQIPEKNLLQKKIYKEVEFFQPKIKSVSQNEDSVIGEKMGEFRVNILEYLKHSRSEFVKIDNIIEKYPDKQDEIFNAIKSLEINGVIYRKGDSILLL